MNIEKLHDDIRFDSIIVWLSGLASERHGTRHAYTATEEVFIFELIGKRVTEIENNEDNVKERMDYE